MKLQKEMVMKTGTCGDCVWLDMAFVKEDQAEALFSVSCFYGHWEMKPNHDEREFASIVRAFCGCADYEAQPYDV